jgi:hypothetical protein
MSFNTAGGAVVADPGNSYQHNSHDFLGGGMGIYYPYYP